jgi:hypothetical protein
LLQREPGQTAAPVIARVETHLVMRGSTAALKSIRAR